MSDGVMSAVTWVAVGLGVLLVVGIVLIAYCCWSHGGDDETDPSTLLDGLLRREQLEDTMLVAGGEGGWQCIVCAYSNNEKHKNCLMCGTSSGFLMTSALTRHKSSGALLKNDESVDDQETARARQRALFKRRMNSMSLRKDLSQRQRGAIRRRLWERKQDTDGKFHWIRQNSTDNSNDTALSGNAMILTSNNRGAGNSRGVQVKGPLESMTDYHNLRSQGFVWQYDDLGRLVWKQAEDVAIDMESFGKVNEGKGEAIDFEGIMAMDFRVKKQWFLVHLAQIATPVTKAVSKLANVLYISAAPLKAVTRENLVQETLTRLTTASPEALHTYLKITFAGEPGIDAGGLLREWFGIICKEIFSEKMGLFVPTKGEDMSYWIDPLSGEKNKNHLQYFRLAGILIGKALFEGLVLDVHLALPLLKHVLGIPISFSDLEFLDEDLHRNSKWLKTNTQVENLCLTFSIMMENGKEVDLKENGRNIDVTDENKDEYLRLVLEYRMLMSIADQLQEFLSGLYDVVPKDLLSVFDYQELELILCGIPTIDTADWKANTKVRYYAAADEDRKRGAPVISEEAQNSVLTWFWIVLESFTPEERARLLQFTTGTSRVPVEGFKGLMSSSGIIHPFTIQLIKRGNDTSDLFPKAHTCFNRLDLPLYRSMDEMETYLTMVSQMEIIGFGLE
ncbi:Hect e3 ubiquitin ligase, partial [Globisporangium splendens]